MEKYLATIESQFLEEGEEAGIREIAFVANPAIKIKGYAFENHLKKMFFADEKKFRIASPILIPSEIYRKKDEEDNEHSIIFTPEELEKIHGDMMKNYTSEDFFNNGHTEEKVPAYLLEVWRVNGEPKKDKAFTEYGLEVPKGSIFGVVQIEDEEYYNKLVEEGKTGLSIEGFFGRKLVEMKVDKTDFADVVVINDKDEVLLLKRSETAEFEPNKLGFAGGGVDKGEIPPKGAERELLEEAGIVAEFPKSLKPVGKADNGDGTNSYYFVTRYNGEIETSNEHSGSEWVEIEDLKNRNLILNQNERFTEIANKALEILKTKTKTMDKIMLPDGEHEINGTIYTVKDGVVVNEKAVETQLTEDEKKAEEAKLAEDAKQATDEEKKKAEEMKAEADKTEEEKKAEEAKLKEDEKKAEEAKLAEDVLTEARVSEMITEKLDEVLKAIGEMKAEFLDKIETDAKGDEVQLSKMEKNIQKVKLFSEED